MRNASSSDKERGRDGWLLSGHVHVGDKAIESKRLREQVRMRDQKHWSRGGHELILKGKKLEIGNFFGDCPLKRQPQSDRYSPPLPQKMQYVTVFVVRLANDRSEKRLKGHFSHPRCRLHQTELN